jgi:class 3 adenylate cyclase/predicted ATPase
MDFGAWLRELELERYEQLFRQNDIDVEMLPDLDDNDLKALGVASLGHRKQLLRAISLLAQSATTTGDKDAAPWTSAERRRLTVMFVDLVGSTSLSAGLDPEDMREVIRAYQNIVAGEIGRLEGYVAKFMGDGVLAYFGYPRAHEDEAERAVRVALALADLIEQFHPPNGGTLSARFGIATGLVVVGDLIGEGDAQERSVVGDTPNLAARLQEMAAPGQVMISEATRRLLPRGFAVERLGEREVKGIAKPVAAFLVTGERPVESRFDAMTGPSPLPMVDRDHDLALLRERWALAKAGEGQCVLLVGEAGIGKSRIGRALLDELAGEEHFRLRYQCSPYHGDSALWPIIQQLIRASDLGADDPVEVQLDKLEALLDRAGGHDAAPLIAALTGIDGTGRYGRIDLTPPVQRARTLEALNAQLVGLAARQPVLMILEDAHWIDPTTLELVERSLDLITAARVMILMTSRPENQPEFSAHPHVARHTLNRLGRRGVEAIIEGLGGESLPTETVDEIAARSDGVPLFIEELTRAILETGETSIPASLHDSLMARLDRVSDVRDIAQIAACIGREFDYPLLAAVAEKPERNLRAALDRLVEAELIFRRGSAPAAHYLFKHALVQDAAHGSLLHSRRRELHARVAKALEDGIGGADAAPELLAHHHTEAGATMPAITNWRRAGQQAAQRAANLEAIQYLQRALALLRNLPENHDRNSIEFDILTHLGPALMVVKGWAASEVGTVYERANELAGSLERSADLVPPLIGIWLYHNARGQYDLADALTTELFQVAGTTSDDSLLLQAHHAAWPIPMFRGLFRTSNEHIETGLLLFDPERHKDHALIYMGHDPAVCAHACGAQAAWALGMPDCARQHATDALDLARRLGHAPTLAFALWYVGGAQAAQGDSAAVLLAAEELLELSVEQKLRQTEASARFLGGWARTMSGAIDEGLEQMRLGFDGWNRIGARSWLQLFNGLYADGLIQGGRYAEALEIIEQAFEIAQETGERWWESRLHHLRAETLLHTGEGEAAVASLQSAIAVARSQDARSWELSAATRLAELWNEQGKRDQARDLLAPVHGWFTEGLGSPGVKAAKRLLVDLA